MAHENATPRPWWVSVGIDNGLPCVDAKNSLGETVEVCEVWGVLADKVEDEGSQSNAALIVEAVNAYDTLRAENERLKSERDAGFNHGYLMAVANIINLHRETVVAADVLLQIDLTIEDAEAFELAEYDMDALERLRSEPRAADFFKRQPRAALSEAQP